MRAIRSIIVVCLIIVVRPAAAQELALSYTAAQAAAGSAVYASTCVTCHGPNLDDGPLGPPLKGPAFIQKYGGKSLDGLFTVLSTTMPTGAPGSLGAAVYAQLLAYMLEANDIVPGQRELPADPRELTAMRIPAGGFSFMAFSPYTARPPADLPNPLQRYAPVTDADLLAPPPEDWIAWRRTYDTHGFSPLDSINRRNVKNLRVVWSWALPPGSNEAVPLVHDGVMFAFGFGDELQALDAATSCRRRKE